LFNVASLTRAKDVERCGRNQRICHLILMCSFIGRIRILFTKMSEESNKKIDKRGR
jgi:hypothetical protein